MNPYIQPLTAGIEFVTVLVTHFTGFLLIDPLLGMGFGLVLPWASCGILRDAAHLLMEGTKNQA